MLERGKMDRGLVEFVVDQLVPKEHLLRKIDAAVDFTQLYEMVEPLYCEDNGRPSIDPVVLFKMVLIHNRTRQKYCCPFRQSKTGVCPCNHKNWNNGKKNRGCTKYKTIPTDYRLSIDRECLRFKRVYALRTECERYNAANLNTVAHISALAVALAAVLHGSHSYRFVKQLRRSV